MIRPAFLLFPLFLTISKGESSSNSSSTVDPRVRTPSTSTPRSEKRGSSKLSVSQGTYSENASESSIPPFAPEVPKELLKVESETAGVRSAAKRVFVMDGTELGHSVEHVVPKSDKTKHFLRQSELSSKEEVSDDFGLGKGIDFIVSSAEAIPTHPVVEEVDSWAQETRAGFMGYFEKLSSIWRKESKSVGNKLFEAADAYSHRFFTLVHVKESDHPVLAAKVTRIIVAMGLSLTLVFVIFGIALHLQKSIVARAHEEASKQLPREQLFFAMPYQHPPTGIIAVE